MPGPYGASGSCQDGSHGTGADHAGHAGRIRNEVPGPAPDPRRHRLVGGAATGQRGDCERDARDHADLAGSRARIDGYCGGTGAAGLSPRRLPGGLAAAARRAYSAGAGVLPAGRDSRAARSAAATGGSHPLPEPDPGEGVFLFGQDSRGRFRGPGRGRPRALRFRRAPGAILARGTSASRARPAFSICWRVPIRSRWNRT